MIESVLGRLRHPLIVGLLLGQALLLTALPIILLYNIAFIEMQSWDMVDFGLSRAVIGILWIAGFTIAVCGIIINVRKLVNTRGVSTSDFSGMNELSDQEYATLNLWLDTSEYQVNKADHFWEAPK